LAAGLGAFTGLRTACAVAQGLGLGLGKPLLPIDSLLIVAEDARGQLAAMAGPLDIGVAMDARMDEAYAARYRWQAMPGRCCRRRRCTPWPHWPRLGSAVPLHALAGSALVAFGARLDLPAPAAPPGDRTRPRRRAAAPGPPAGGPRAGIDAAQALPLYLRDKVALTTAEREAVKQAKAAAL
jgi:tRNA threonylcarbamoyladenosine biosynthesis protein TsaB